MSISFSLLLHVHTPEKLLLSTNAYVILPTYCLLFFAEFCAFTASAKLNKHQEDHLICKLHCCKSFQAGMVHSVSG